MAASPRAFVLRHTRLRPVPGLDGIRLHLVDDVLSLWHAVQLEQDDPDPALPFWAVAWAGGTGLARYLREHPEVVTGRRVLDLASGSGLCAIAAMQAGAAVVTGVDVDQYAAAAIALNARANGWRVTVVQRDVLGDDAPDVDVILAGDCCYEARPRRAPAAVAAGRPFARHRRPAGRPRPALPAPGRARRSSPPSTSARRANSTTWPSGRAASTPCGRRRSNRAEREVTSAWCRRQDSNLHALAGSRF